MVSSLQLTVKASVDPDAEDSVREKFEKILKDAELDVQMALLEIPGVKVLI